ncbi:DUF4232 domain-containing protein [Geodermatophilus sp. SYSU D00965]
MSRVLRAAAWPTLLAGLVLMAWAGLRSARYRPGWLEPEVACLRSGECRPADVEAGLTALWWAVGAGAVVLAVGVVLVALRRPPVAVGPPARGRPPLVHAVVVAAAGSAVGLLLELPLLVALFAGAHAVPAALAVLWLVQAEVLAGLGLRLGPPGTSPRRAWLTGLAVSGAATFLVALAVGAGWAGSGDWWLLLLADGALLGLGTAVARLTGEAGRGGSPRHAAVALAVFGVAAFVLLGGVQALVRTGVPALVALGPPLPEEPALTAPAPTAPPASPVPLPPPVTTPPPPRVAADVPCAVGDLDLAVVGFDAAMGARAASVQARNTGDAPCWVEGVPVVTLLQGGRPLALTVEPGRSPTGGPAPVERVGIAPGGTALSLLTWRTYAGWADAQTPQSVTVALDAGSPAVEAGIVGGAPQVPFDIADGGAWGIAPWAPPWN